MKKNRMKKNRMMRIASVMLVLALLTTCVISGSFAKYVTSGSGSDSARVAKWGILIGIEGDGVFSNEYATDDDTYAGAVSVQAEGDYKVVAPGTSSDGLTATVSGKPEVAFRLKLALSNISVVKLPAGTYTDYTQLGADGTYSKTFTLTEDYKPVQFHMTINVGGRTINVPFTDLEQIETTLNNLGNGDGLELDCDPGQEIPDGSTITLSWEWPFEGNDAADTYLGNVAAGKITDANAVTDISYKFTATATQID